MEADAVIYNQTPGQAPETQSKRGKREYMFKEDQDHDGSIAM